MENISTKVWKSGFGLAVVMGDGLEVLLASFLRLWNIEVSKSLKGVRREIVTVQQIFP